MRSTRASLKLNWIFTGIPVGILNDSGYRSAFAMISPVCKVYECTKATCMKTTCYSAWHSCIRLPAYRLAKLTRNVATIDCSSGQGNLYTDDAYSKEQEL